MAELQKVHFMGTKLKWVYNQNQMFVDFSAFFAKLILEHKVTLLGIIL